MITPRAVASLLRNSGMPLLPRPLRSLAARAYGAGAQRWVDARMRSLARSDRPIVAGPWLSEIGFELLYWIPFLRHLVERWRIDPARISVISRGGVASWYEGVLGGHYLDLYRFAEVDALRERNAARAARQGGYKSMREDTLDREIFDWARATLDVDDLAVLHPALMFRLFRPYFWAAVNRDWIRRRTRVRRIEGPGASDVAGTDHIAVKIYFNDAFPDSPMNREFAAAVIASLASRQRVIVLGTNRRFDDHAEFQPDRLEGVVVEGASVAPADNLAHQTAIIAGAAAFVGNYGGFAYLPPLLGVPALTFYSDGAGFSDTHLQLARSFFSTPPFGRLQVTAAREVDVAALAGIVAATGSAPEAT